MTRTHERKLGVRRYKDFGEERLEEALRLIVENELSVREASMRYKIPFSTLYNRYTGRHIHTVGHPTYFSMADERALIRAAVTCGDGVFPLTEVDLQHFTKNYLDRQGKIIPRLLNNKLGINCVEGLLKRNKTEVCQRLSAYIKRGRASISHETSKQYFENLRSTIRDVPANQFV